MVGIGGGLRVKALRFGKMGVLWVERVCRVACLTDAFCSAVRTLKCNSRLFMMTVFISENVTRVVTKKSVSMA